ncbi:protein GDAP2 homolog isoform X2 [Episyrphus balteatus]|uniref:protein GDAP2 homolog isoform X2 n=1 Tax=Episyrphus balteatus TaxID=286459 RepID=UPI002485595F|nr:protein GDAP2 homolog isoform X2 [Episyrphus balteatus]
MRLDSNSNEDFKSLGAKNNKIKIETLSKWGGLEKEKNPTRLPVTNYSSVVLPRHSTSPFPVSDSINSRFIIWDGDITLLEVDAITNTTDETLTESNIISDRVLAAAGNQLKDEIQNHIKETFYTKQKN